MKKNLGGRAARAPWIRWCLLSFVRHFGASVNKHYPVFDAQDDCVVLGVRLGGNISLTEKQSLSVGAGSC